MERNWMARRVVLLAAVVAAPLGLIGPVRAESIVGPVRVRVGAAFPVAGTPHTAELAVGAEVDARGVKAPGDGQPSLTLDWISITSDRGSQRRDVNVFPLLVNTRWQSGLKRPLEYGAGLGITFASSRVPEMDLSSDLNLGWQVFARYNLSPRLQSGARFLASDNPGRDGVFLIQLGYQL